MGTLTPGAGPRSRAVLSRRGPLAYSITKRGFEILNVQDTDRIELHSCHSKNSRISVWLLNCRGVPQLKTANESDPESDSLLGSLALLILMQVWSTELPSSLTSSGGHTIFNPKDSSTFQVSTGSSWQISYGDGSSASGTVGTDNVTIGGLTIKDQAVELATTLSTEFQQDSSDGLLGLAWGSINTVTPTPVQTPVENMISQDDIPQNMELFTAHLGSWRDASDPGNEGDSFYTFGFIDQPTLTAAGVTASEISYTPVDNSQGFWMFDSTSATINGTSIPRTGNTAIADTGTTLALVDDATCTAIYNAIPGAKYDSTQQGYIFPTATTADQLPTVTFAVGGQQFAIQKEALAFAAAETGFVYGGIQSRGSMTFDIFGDVFLKGVYAVCHFDPSRFAVDRIEKRWH